MPLAYKVDILTELKACGYSTDVLKKEKLLSAGVIQSLQDNKPVSLHNIGKICDLLECEPGDILIRVNADGRYSQVENYPPIGRNPCTDYR